MDRIAALARFSVLRASGFAGLAIMMGMMGLAGDPAAALRFGAFGLVVLSSAMWLWAVRYPKRRRIEETEVWIMLLPEERPPKNVARPLIINAMRAELIEKARWWALLALAMVALSALITLVEALR